MHSPIEPSNFPSQRLSISIENGNKSHRQHSLQTSQEMETENFVVNTKFKGSKINMKQYQKKLQLKNKYQSKKQKSVHLKIQETLNDNYEKYQSEMRRRNEKSTRIAERRAFTSHRPRVSLKRQCKTAQKSIREESLHHQEKKLNFESLAFPIKVTPTKRYSYFVSENLEPKTTQFMNMIINGGQAQEKSNFEQFLTTHKKLSLKLRIKSLNLREKRPYPLQNNTIDVETRVNYPLVQQLSLQRKRKKQFKQQIYQGGFRV